jgi:DNA replication and repair protein RecF
VSGRVVSALRVDQFRCLQQVQIEPHSRLNLVVGPNASGKTSLVEAIYAVARGRSFRGARLAECLRHGEKKWRVAAKLASPDRPGDVLDLLWRREGVRLQLNGEATPLTEVARLLPVQLIEPSLHRLVDEGPAYRRRYLDWGLFHVEHDYLNQWRRYTAVLRQRNASLRQGRPAAQVQAWNLALAEHGQSLDDARRRFLTGWQTSFVSMTTRLLGITDVEVRLSSGWPESQSLADVLASRIDTDRTQGTTTAGPHRAELRIAMDGHPVRGTVSRGQQKMLVAALVLSQSAYMRSLAGVNPVLLLDDFTAELGQLFQERLREELIRYPGQCFITAVAKDGALADWQPGAMFHVEHGVVRITDA